ncbi:hypothetical protein [Salmonella phage SD-2_S15]|nr:hypothetical protein [Salmonella phage SD-2_S15]WPK20569.1 hypothetical protein [Salmonella phage SD-15_S21]
MIEMEGTLVYDPDRGTMKKKKDFWLVLQLPLQLVRYYQYFIRTDLHIDVKDPQWGAHVSIVRGEVSQHQEYWKKYDGMKVKIKFNPCIEIVKDKKNPGSFFIIEFEDDFITHIRNELGLPTKYFKYHITVGRTYYD